MASVGKHDLARWHQCSRWTEKGVTCGFAAYEDEDRDDDFDTKVREPARDKPRLLAAPERAKATQKPGKGLPAMRIYEPVANPLRIPVQVNGGRVLVPVGPPRRKVSFPVMPSWVEPNDLALAESRVTENLKNIRVGSTNLEERTGGFVGSVRQRALTGGLAAAAVGGAVYLATRGRGGGGGFHFPAIWNPRTAYRRP